MQEKAVSNAQPGQQTNRNFQQFQKNKESLLSRIWRERYIHLLILPGLLYFIIYKYVPMAGLIIAFQNFSVFLSFWESEWVGFEHFIFIFNDREVIQVIWNTLTLSFYMLAFTFPIPILISIMLNEIKFEPFKRVLQSVIYLPHFFSWVIVVSIVTIFFKGEGVVNNLLSDAFGMNPIGFLTEPSMFKPLLVLEVIWKESGWSTIIFLAAIAGINPQLFEAAIVDGASRWRQMWHVTLPGLRPTIVILFILSLGSVLDTGFEQVFLSLNPFTMEKGNVLDTYVYFQGIQAAQFSVGAAVGMFKSLVGLVLIIAANKFAKRLGSEGIY